MAVLEKGRYWIGDPCYVFPNHGPMSDRWDKLIEKNDCFNAGPFTEIDGGKIKVWADGTTFGDGLYSSNINFNFPVDAGLLGIIPEETVIYLNTIDGVYDESQIDGLGIFVEFEKEFTIRMQNGYFRFGYIIIDTRNENEDY